MLWRHALWGWVQWMEHNHGWRCSWFLLPRRDWGLWKGENNIFTRVSIYQQLIFKPLNLFPYVPPFIYFTNYFKKTFLTLRGPFRTDLSIWKDGCLEILQLKMRDDVAPLLIGTTSAQEISLLNNYIFSLFWSGSAACHCGADHCGARLLLYRTDQQTEEEGRDVHQGCHRKWWGVPTFAH